MAHDDSGMVTLRDAVDRLERSGYTDSFRAEGGGLLALKNGRCFIPEDLSVDEVVRFEGPSDPEEEAILFALSTSDNEVRGTFVAVYGPLGDPIAGEMVRRLEVE